MISSANLDELQDIIKDYDSFNDFVKKGKKVKFTDFDNYISSKISLFLVHENIDLEVIQGILKYIEKSLRPLFLIFERPIIHLKEIEDILPIEMVHRIDNDTFHFAAVHSELWDNFTASGLKPKKLRTMTYDNNWCIYENQVFTQTVDDIFRYLRKTIMNIRSLLFTSKNMDINLLERVNHANYYLALGKLQTGYLRNFNRSYSIADDLVKRISFIYTNLRSYTHYKVYRLNEQRIRNKRVPLKVTNILKMQKNYHSMYLLAKKLNNLRPANISFPDETLLNFDKAYLTYCSFLIMFSLLHLDFNYDKKLEINLGSLNNDFMFKDWLANLKNVTSKGRKCLMLTLKKSSTYKILFVPKSIMAKEIFEVDPALKPDEVAKISPFATSTTSLYISISDIDSFLRIQQIILRAMVYCDAKHITCPYCKDILVKGKSDNEMFICPTCKTKIEKKICPTTNKPYYASSIARFTFKPDKTTRGMSVISEQLEFSKAMHYRNITDLNEYGDPVCPHCKQVHEE